MEPSSQTMEEIGRLCSAWAYLEAATEQTVWGVIGADAKIGCFITWRLDLRSRWQIILDEAPNKLSEEDQTTLRVINRDIKPAAHDRNVIVHGLIHAAAVIDGPAPPAGTVLGPLGEKYKFARTPCWTTFRGAGSGKNFPISTTAVKIVRENIQKIAKQVVQFNSGHGYANTNQHSDKIENDWPKPLE